MNRRKLLVLASAGTGLALAGCLERITGSQAEHRSFEPTLDTSDDCTLEHNVGLIQPDPSSTDAPLSIEVSVTNTLDEHLYFYPGGSALLHQVNDEQFYLFLDSIAAYQYDTEREGWKLTEPVPRITQDAGELAPEETTRRTYLILPDSDTAVPYPDTFTFETSFHTSTERFDGEEAWMAATECEVELELSLT